MESWLHFLENFWSTLKSGNLPNLGVWNYLLLAVLVAIEGPIATLLGAAAASAGLMRPALVFLAAATGNLTSDMLWYSLGYAGKIEWIYRYGRWLGVRRKYLDRLQDAMHLHAARILLLAKLSAAFMIPSLIAAGVAKVPWRKWFPVLLFGETLWTGSLVLIGFYATEAIKQVEKGVEYLGMAGAFIFLLGILYLVRRALRKNSEFEALSKNGSDTEQNVGRP